MNTNKTFLEIFFATKPAQCPVKLSFGFEEIAAMKVRVDDSVFQAAGRGRGVEFINDRSVVQSHFS
jgi:hypothetical protein